MSQNTLSIALWACKKTKYGEWGRKSRGEYSWYIRRTSWGGSRGECPHVLPAHQAGASASDITLPVSSAGASASDFTVTGSIGGTSHPEKQSNYEKRKHRKLQAAWKDKFQCLKYNAEDDKILCDVCQSCPAWVDRSGPSSSELPFTTYTIQALLKCRIPDSDLAYRWHTKRKLLNLVEVCTPTRYRYNFCL